MKIVFITLLSGLLFSSLKPEVMESQAQHSIEGTWELIHQYTYDGTSITDTILPSDGYRQIKMFYDGKVMWTRFVPKDSVEWFGYGNYSATDSSLVETLEYGSASMMKIIDTMRIFSFKLEIGPDHYSQITRDNQGNPIFSENYKRIQ